ncbi:MAG: His-Xaa-Ser system radical SAM maturase HxsC [Deltaproteobacteria bacterium]|jgi:His-Xaa-Ser system radical SAM maturase HxsC|nr:His-Xaa-Ser system radical SAM maturase HxsC [Deltaproteobacteria bacterium]
MLKISGNPSTNFRQSIIGRVTTKNLPFYKRYQRIYINEHLPKPKFGYLAILTTSRPINKFYYPLIVGNIDSSEFLQIKDNDIIKIDPDGSINILWQYDSIHNALLVTESCNCRCLMCPQPPKNHDNTYNLFNNKILDLLQNLPIPEVCLTGGEPTIVKSEFLTILKRIYNEHPESRINVLTNAKIFSDTEFCYQILPNIKQNTIFCVSLHSDIESIHDTIVGKSDSFLKTQEGIYNLSLYNIPIEIRFVINKLNCERILEFSDFIYRYFPFVFHVVFMSQEICGLATQNFDLIYVDPFDYKEELRKATLFLMKRGLNVSVYNTPLCLSHPDIFDFHAKSISPWKNDFILACEICQKKEICCGFFTTSTSPISSHIQPF